MCKKTPPITEEQKGFHHQYQTECKARQVTVEGLYPLSSANVFKKTFLLKCGFKSVISSTSFPGQYIIYLNSPMIHSVPFSTSQVNMCCFCTFQTLLYKQQNFIIPRSTTFYSSKVLFRSRSQVQALFRTWKRSPWNTNSGALMGCFVDWQDVCIGRDFILCAAMGHSATEMCNSQTRQDGRNNNKRSDDITNCLQCQYQLLFWSTRISRRLTLHAKPRLGFIQ